MRDYEAAELRTKLAAAQGRVEALRAALAPFAAAWAAKQRIIDQPAIEKARRRREERALGPFYSYSVEGSGERVALTGEHLRNACETLASTGGQAGGCDADTTAASRGRDALDATACRAIMISLEEALHRNDPTLIGACRRLIERFNEGGIVPTLKAKRELDALMKEPKQ